MPQDRNNRSLLNCDARPATSDSETIEQDLRKEQAEKNVLATELQDLKKQLADTENKENITQHRRRRRKAPQISDNIKCSQVKDIAHKFTYMSILWLHQPSETFQLSWDEEYNPPDCFHSEDGWLQAQFRELLQVIPKDLHQDMKDETFINTFMGAMHQQRSNASSRVRPEAGAAIFRRTDMEFANRANMFRELIGWISGDDTSGSYKVLAPILFRDYKGQMDKWKLFRNPILIQTYAALMLGPSSVKKAKGSDLYYNKFIYLITPETN
ncbi:hypothetical protein M422DRAFT_246786 [Sphaerobolus stellatus SS14]|nr:hypothetical protein M422DRAFT_246786 [Sphaerobolus stellatus SS14]